MQAKKLRARLGWCPDIPDQRDRLFGNHFEVKPASRLAEIVSLREQCSRVRDQGDLGSCTGFAMTGAVEYLRATDADKRSTIYSPLFVYYEERRLEGSIKSDDGAYIRDGIKVLVKIGAAPEIRWPYVVSKFAKTPSASAYREATRWRLDATYYRCSTADEILSALAAHHPVVGGISIYSYPNEADRSGDLPLPGPSDDMLGGHAIMFTGFDRNAGKVSFKNSWGTRWGDAGYGTVSTEYVEDRGLSDDFWCLVKEAPHAHA